MTLEISEMFNHENAIFYRFWIWLAELVKFVYLSCILQICKKKIRKASYFQNSLFKILYFTWRVSLICHFVSWYVSFYQYLGKIMTSLMFKFSCTKPNSLISGLKSWHSVIPTAAMIQTTTVWTKIRCKSFKLNRKFAEIVGRRIPANIYLFKVNSKDTKMTSWRFTPFCKGFYNWSWTGKC